MSIVVDIINTTYEFLWLIILIAVLGIIAFFVLVIAKFKFKVQVRELASGRKIITNDKAKLFKSKDGVLFWKLMKGKDVIPIPPEESIELDKHGKKHVVVYKTQTGEYIYAKDTNNHLDPPEELLKIPDKTKREEELKKWRKENNIVQPFQPLTTIQRQILINQVIKAQERKNKGWRDMILPIAGIGALVILVVSLMIFYGEIAKPVLEAKEIDTAQLKAMQEIVDTQKEIKLGIQKIEGETEVAPD